MAKKKDKMIDPLEAQFDAVVRKLIDPAPHKVHKTNDYNDVLSSSPAPSAKQLPLDLGIQVQKNVGGIEMGVPNRPAFLDAKNLQPFINNDLEDVLNTIPYRDLNGTEVEGYNALILPRICRVYSQRQCA